MIVVFCFFFKKTTTNLKAVIINKINDKNNMNKMRKTSTANFSCIKNGAKKAQNTIAIDKNKNHVENRNYVKIMSKEICKTGLGNTMTMPVLKTPSRVGAPTQRPLQ